MSFDLQRARAVGSSVLASTLRGWRGSSASRSVQPPAQLLELFDREGCAHCRFVREALTELNLDVRIVPIPSSCMFIAAVNGVYAGAVCSYSNGPSIFGTGSHSPAPGKCQAILYTTLTKRNRQARGHRATVEKTDLKSANCGGHHDQYYGYGFHH